MNEAKCEYNKQFLTEREVARIIGFTIRTVQEWRITGSGPKAYKFGSKGIRYKLDDLNEWIKSSEICGGNQ